MCEMCDGPEFDGPDLDALAFDMLAEDPFEWRVEMGFLTPPPEAVEEAPAPPPADCEMCEDAGCGWCTEPLGYDGPAEADPDGWMAAQDAYDRDVYGP